MQVSLAFTSLAVLQSYAVRLRTQLVLNRSDEPVELRWDSYNFQEEWTGLNFAERWSIFSSFVPTDLLQDFQDEDLDVAPVCHPALVGPEDSEKLAILMHGFLACPGMWFRVVPRLLAAGYRVMLPTLPGHGRKPKELGKRKFEDVLEAMPTSSHEYLAFADALGLLARQFKKEHPRGEVVVAGHSLGGAVTATYAMSNPDVVDRVMLLNPMFGLSWGMVESIVSWAPNFVTSKGSACEKKRAYSSGGTCQFQLQHVSAMVEFAYSVLCCKWGLKGACKTGSAVSRLFQADAGEVCRRYGVDATVSVPRQRELFGQMKGFQVVTTKGEHLVDNDAIWHFVVETRKFRMNGEFDFCYWPSDLGHSYISNRPEPGKSAKTKWWHPYVEKSMAEFLEYGRRIDTMLVGASISMCVTGPGDVKGDKLTRIPAVQHARSYLLAEVGRGNVLLNRPGLRASTYAPTDQRNQELELIFLDSPDHALLITMRSHRNGNINQIYYIYPSSVVVPQADEKDCVRLTYHMMSTTKPLVSQNFSLGAELAHDTEYFCARGLVAALCRHLQCEKTS